MLIRKKPDWEYLTIADRKAALAEHLGIDIGPIRYQGENLFTANGLRYLVVTDEEADDLIRDGITLVNMRHSFGLPVEEELMRITEHGRGSVLAEDEEEARVEEFYIYKTQ